MFKKIVRFSIRKKLFVVLTTLFLMIGGIYSMLTLPIDAVADITNNQVQIVTVSPTLAPQEVEQLITFPIEVAMSNIMNVEEIRSVSRFGLSLVTVVFKESVPTLDARQLVNEQIQTVAGEIPSELGVPEMMPITTGLGEIYQYVLKVAPGYEDKYDAMELRTIQDWIVKRQLSGIPGIVEINSFGGYLKQYEVAVDPDTLYSLNITISDVYDALSRNNQNTGGSYIEKVNRAYYIRLWYCGRRFHCDIGRNSGTYLRSSVDGTYPQQRRNGCRGGERSWQCRTKRHVCRFDYSDCVLPYIDFDRNRRKILYADGQDAGVLYYRCFAAVADLCADDGFLAPEAYGIGKTDIGRPLF